MRWKEKARPTHDYAAQNREKRTAQKIQVKRGVPALREGGGIRKKRVDESPLQ